MAVGDVIVFVGPTISVSDASQILDADYRPPAGQGDFYRAALSKPTAIGLIDGYFNDIPSVWHKEILFAMSRGVHCAGASSMGALRAAELAAFGMVGVGQVFEQFAAGTLTRDDEVAVSHDPMSHGQLFQSDALVNMRATFRNASASGVISDSQADLLVETAQGLPYWDRTYPIVLSQQSPHQIPASILEELKEWLTVSQVDIKRSDAVELLHKLSELGQAEEPFQAQFHFEDTSIWRSGITDHQSERSQPNQPAA